MKYGIRFTTMGMFVFILFSYGENSLSSTAESKEVVGTVPPVGFVVHESEGFLDELDEYGVTAELSNVFVWRLKSTDPLVVDFDIPEKWLRRIHQSKHTAYPIIDTSVFHSSGWRAEEAAGAGQQMHGADGHVFKSGATTWASLYSPIFRAGVLDYADQLVAWIVKNDQEHRIPAYVNGAEWFMPGMVDYNPLGIARFQHWLIVKYKDLDMLNEQWGSNFESWNQVDPPRGTLLGEGYAGMRTVGFSGDKSCLYGSPDFLVEAGEEYWIQVSVKQRDVAAGLCGIKLLCFNENGKPILYSGDGQFYWCDAPSGGQIGTFCRIPDDAVSARMELKLMGPGSVEFSDPQVKRLPCTENLVPAEPEKWKFSVQGLSSDEYENEAKSGTYTLNMGLQEFPCEQTGLAWDDWITFSYESMADWLNTCAVHIKQRDPSREVMSYVGCVFGTATLGDFAMYWQRLDISLANSPAIDINGIQVCIAGDDYTMTTTPVDMTRKYRKPIYLTDFVDFPYGLWSGFTATYRGVMTAIQHGANGTLSYAWADTVAGTDYQYSKQMSGPQLKKFVDDQLTAIKAVEGCEVHTDIAFILPVMPYSLADKSGYKSDLLDIGGWCHLLNDTGIIADFYTPYELANRNWDLSGYKMVILPDCPVLPSEVNEILTEYVRQGGVVLGSGRVPSIDLRNRPLNPRLMKSSSNFLADRFETNRIRGEQIDTAQKIVEAVENPRLTIRGAGKVIWIDEKLGKAYWGQARRGRSYGNTPAVYLKPSYTPTAEVMRRGIREELRQTLATYTPDSLVQLKGDGEGASISLFTEAKSGEGKTVLFVVNHSKGRHLPVTVQLSHRLAGSKGTVLIDFDRTINVAVGRDGQLKLPDFSDTVIVTFQGKE